jgi:hypothetical protein
LVPGEGVGFQHGKFDYTRFPSRYDLRMAVIHEAAIDFDGLIAHFPFAFLAHT